MSPYCKAWMIDGRLAALGGVEGPLVAESGYVWLVISREAAKHPIAVLRTAKRHLSEIMKVKKELSTTIIRKDSPSFRLAGWLGFENDWTPSDLRDVVPLIYKGT
jgi:hypothetical protein